MYYTSFYETQEQQRRKILTFSINLYPDGVFSLEFLQAKKNTVIKERRKGMNINYRQFTLTYSPLFFHDVHSHPKKKKKIIFV